MKNRKSNYKSLNLIKLYNPNPNNLIPKSLS